jgi:hypothetical protein
VTSLPSLRALDLAQGARFWLAAEAADMRCGFDRLAERVSGRIRWPATCSCSARAGAIA